MTREEFLRRLSELLSDVTDEERAEAIRFYEEYLDDAGPEQEAQVLAELAARKRWRPSSAPTCPAAGGSRSPRRRKRGPAPARPPSRCRPVRGRVRCRLRPAAGA